MKIYQVGGSVRDELLGLPVNDKDFVVVGATVEEMIAKGFKPVGKDFPVFLHPKTKEEYALARTEKKIGKGYGGFTFFADPSITLEEDLLRRDFTINAMAKDEAGRIIDPYGGREDIGKKIFRHVSSAFSEDPLRVMRLARFLARFSDFSVAKETSHQVDQIILAGEITELTLERRLLEWEKGLFCERPDRMVLFLHQHSALGDALAIDEDEKPAYKTHLEKVVQALCLAAHQQASFSVRLAILLFSDAVERPICKTKFPLSHETKRLIKLFSETLSLLTPTSLNDAKIFHRLLKKADYVRQHKQFLSWLSLIEYYHAIFSLPVDWERMKKMITAAAETLAAIKTVKQPGQTDAEVAAIRIQQERVACQAVLDQHNSKER